MPSSFVLVSAGGIAFNLLFDAAASSAAAAAFRTGIEQAATLLSQAITNKITVNINIDWSGTGNRAAAKPDNGLFETYSTVRSDLIKGAAPGDTTFNALPNATSVQGQSQIAVWNPQLKLFGLLGANDTTTDDGTASFTTDIGSTDLVGVALHELTHVLGRVPYGPSPDIFDLFRFTSTGTRLLSNSIPSASAYFSVDNGNSKLADYGRNSDPSDFINSGIQGAYDSFNEYYSNNTYQYLSSVDLEQLDALGYRVTASTTLTVALKNDTGISSSDKLTDDATLTGVGTPGAMVTLSNNGISAGSVFANAAGVWTFTPSFADGQHTIVASEVNGLGQTVTTSLSFWLATKVPAIAASGSVSGQTNLTSETIAVSASAESAGANAIAYVEIFDGAADLGAASLSAGTWTFTASKLLSGVHNFTAVAADTAGNTARAVLPQVVVSGTAPSLSYTLAQLDFAGVGVTDTRPKGINDLGEIVGYYIDGRADNIGADGATYYEHGFYSTKSGTARQYTSIENPDTPADAAGGEVSGPDRTRAFSVNNQGDIAGWFSQDETGTSSAGTSYTLPDAGFIESANWPSTFGTLAFSPLNDLGTHALGINAGDQIVGYYEDGAGHQHGFLRNFTGYGIRGNYLTIDAPNAVNTILEGINDNGEIVGFYQFSDGAFHGFSYNISTGSYAPIDFNGATSTEALGVNNSGTIAGFYLDSAGKKHGFVRSASGQLTIIDHPNAGSGGTLVGGIDNAGDIVGWYTAPDGHDHGFTGTAQAEPAPPAVPGDVASNILFQNVSGEVALWQTDGLTITASGAIGTTPGSAWFAMGTGAFYAGDTADIVWQNVNGQVAVWQKTGTKVQGGAVVPNNPGPTWHIKGTGDFYGDGHSDILWENDNGMVALWELNGATLVKGDLLVSDPGPTWHIRGTGHFYGDGNTDILWQNDEGLVAIWDMKGATIVQGAIVASNPGPTWRIEGTGDFYGDGHTDILWQNDNGSVALWNMQGAAIVQGAIVANPGPTWHIKATGDFNGDGKTDIVWQNDNGTVTTWEMNGSAIAKGGSVLGNPGTAWSILGGDENMRFIYSGKAGESLAGSPASPDEFVFTNFATGTHMITGFNPVQDLIELSISHFANFAAVQAAASATGAGTSIALGNASTLLLTGIAPSSLHASNFALG